jgi:hypothetical protein
MSRHFAPRKNGTWVFGWDQMLQSFFLHFHDKNVSEDDNPVIWLGADPKTSMYEVEQLVQTAGKHGLIIDHIMQDVLYTDKDEGR